MWDGCVDMETGTLTRLEGVTTIALSIRGVAVGGRRRRRRRRRRAE